MGVLVMTAPRRPITSGVSRPEAPIPTTRESPPPRTIVYRPITSAGRFIRWKDQTPGFSLEGVWCGSRHSAHPGYGDLGVLRLPTGAELTFGMPTMLENEMLRVPINSPVVIQYDGKVQGKKNVFHAFTVSVDVEVEVAERLGPNR
jgi:hypothetical protein